MLQIKFSRKCSAVADRLKDESGQTLIFVALSMTFLLGFLGLATDVGTLFYAKRQIQTAADAAAIAGASELNYGAMLAAARDAATQNGITNGSGGSVVTAVSPPVYGNYAGNTGYVEATVSKPQSTIFMGMFGWSPVTVAARAVAYWGSSRTCIVTLGTSGTGISVTTSGSSPTLNAPSCGISDNSSSSTALNVVSSGAPHPITAKSIGISGNYSQTGGTVSPTPVTGIVPVSDPLAYLPAPSGGACLPNPNIVASGGPPISISQGNYCNGISIVASGSTINFASGTYNISNGFSIIGSGITINGSGVTFYISSGAVSITPSGSTFNLTAPTSGTYSGVLFDQSASDTSAAQITESGSTSTFDGVVYFPNASFTMTASGSSTNLYLAFVVKSLSLTTSGTTINDYASLTGASPIGAATLAE